VGAPEADKLVDAGITEGASRSHPGQGTTNRRFFFANVMLEFLWVHDATETGGDIIRPTHLLERWQQRKTQSPYGICFRPVADAPDTSPIFNVWDYKPPYLLDDMAIQVAHNAGVLHEPFLFFLPWAHAPENPPQHPGGFHTLTSVKLNRPVTDDTSPAMEAVIPHLQIVTSDAHHMTLTFDNGSQGEALDLRPSLSLLIVY
ncbi:MAG: hypothetical protein AAFR22_15625, partial [Chloroflexota bacterium]